MRQSLRSDAMLPSTNRIIDPPPLLWSFSAGGIGVAALTTLLAEVRLRGQKVPRVGGLPELPHFAPTAKRVIYLFQSGGPSQIELFDYKPRLGGVSRNGSAGRRFAWGSA